MKIIEELKLKDTIEYIMRFEKKHESLGEIYQYIGDLNLFSIQGHNYQFDKEFFDEVSFVLSVIITIIKHPHIRSFDVDEIIRADLAGHIENDSFFMTCHDPKLWRDKDGEMSPEEVYYHEHIDEIKIYENIFIGMLINLIEQDLKKSLEFYVSLLPTLTYKNNLYTNEDVKYSIAKIEKELKKIRYIKDTFFYKQIKKCNLSNRKVIPTNILLKDRLYNYCFKFYKKFIRYEDFESLYSDFTKYYFYLVLQNLKKRKANLVKVEDDTIYLNWNGFDLKFWIAKKLPIIKCNITNGVTNDVELICLADLASLEKLVKDDVISLDYNHFVVTMWNLYDDDDVKLNNVALTESELIKMFLDEALRCATIDKDIYTRYCPICKARAISLDNDVYTCTTCHSKYTFVLENKAWFLKVKR